MTNFQISITLSLTCLMLLLSSACSKSDDTDTSSPAANCLSDSMMELVSLDEVKLESYSSRLLLSGQVTVDKDRVYRVYAAAGGVVAETPIRTGDYVRKGQVLARIQSPEIAGFRKEEIEARSELNLAERNLRLAKSLRDSGVFSDRDVYEAQTAVHKAEAEIERIKNLAQILGLSEGGTDYTVRSPESGFVIQRNISAGMKLDAGSEEAMFEIADLRQVWVEANLYESDIRLVKPGDNVSITTLAYPENQFSGKIQRISSILDPERRVARAVVSLSNPDFLLKPGMFANVEVLLNGDNVMSVIPADALIFDNNRHFVVVYKDPCDIEVRNVAFSSRNRTKAYIREGLDPGETVVSNKQLLIYNQSIN